MAPQIDDRTPAIQKRVPPRPMAGRNCQSSSVTFITLGDGHAVPSISAVSSITSTKPQKLMDTLFKRVQRPKAQNPHRFGARTDPTGRIQDRLFSTRVLRNNRCKSSSINKTAKIGRHSFRSIQDRNHERSIASEESLRHSERNVHPLRQNSRIQGRLFVPKKRHLEERACA